MTHQPGVYVPLRALFLVFDHLVPCNVGFDASATSDMRVHACGWG